MVDQLLGATKRVWNSFTPQGGFMYALGVASMALVTLETPDSRFMLVYACVLGLLSAWWWWRVDGDAR